jgi:hypothetical protein
VFSAFDPMIVSGLFVKEASIADNDGKLFDFYHRLLLAEPAPITKQSHDDMQIVFVPLGQASGRWANYDNEELFVVYEEADLGALRSAITGPIKPRTSTDGRPAAKLDSPAFC